MNNWYQNIDTCKILWNALFNLKQISTGFNESGEIKIKELSFFDSVRNNQILNQQAFVVAYQLDTIFRSKQEVSYQKYINRSTAVSSMFNILTDDTKKLKDLASMIEKCYLFFKEK